MKPHPPHAPALAAFSLVESVIAIALAVTAVLTIIGLLPVGLGSLRSATATQAQARIMQTVAADFQMKGWGAASAAMTLPSKTFYFDIRGAEVEAASEDRIFTAQAEVLDPSPAMPGEAAPSAYLKSLRVRITSEADAEAALKDPKRFRERGVIVANLEETK